MKQFDTGAVRGTDADGTRYDLITPIGLRRLAEAYAEGAAKYGENNWLKGIPASDLMNHALRHLFKWLEGDRSEDHLGHALWNVATLAHFEETRPDLMEGCGEQSGEAAERKVAEHPPTKPITHVYIAGPHTVGDVDANIAKAIDVADNLLARGLTPFVPHLTHYWHAKHEQSYETWLDYDLRWLRRCDALLRLPGFSLGADMEVAFAKEHGIPYFESMCDLMWHVTRSRYKEKANG